MTDSDFVLLLTKLLPLMLYPLSQAIGLIVLALGLGWIGYRRIAMMCLVVAVAGLWVVSTPSFSDWALSTLENQHPPLPVARLPAADVAIVLGGAIDQKAPPRVAIDLHATADRVLHASRIYRAGKVDSIFVTGGNLPWAPKTKSEAQHIRDLLIEWGVPDRSIELAGQSRNTYENALEAQALQQRRPFATALLITSASHMPRSMAVFQRAGLPVTAAATDYEVVAARPWTPLRWLPDANALAQTTKAVKEWIGLWAYRMRGYA